MLERRPLRFAVIIDDEDASDTTSAISHETGAFLSVQIAKEEHLMKHLCKKNRRFPVDPDPADHDDAGSSLGSESGSAGSS